MSSSNARFAPGPRTQVRFKNRAIAESDAIAAIIDESLVVHVAYLSKDGVPQCLPMAFGRRDNTIYLHGAIANAHLASVESRQCSLTFTLLDGFVFARSAYHHSMNYRCVVAIGETRSITELGEKREALAVILEHAAPARGADCVGMTDAEVRSTKVIAVDVQEAVAKRRQGPPLDEAADIANGNVFSGVVNLVLQATSVSRDPSMFRPLAVPPSIRGFAERHGHGVILEAEQGDLLLSSDPSRIDNEWLHQVLSERAYWALGISAQKLRASLDNSLLFGAYREGKQVGFARVLTDSSRIAFLADVFVDNAHRRQGVGSQLVEFVLSHPVVKRCDRVLLGTRDAQPLYAKFGFKTPTHNYLVRVNPDVEQPA